MNILLLTSKLDYLRLLTAALKLLILAITVSTLTVSCTADKPAEIPTVIYKVKDIQTGLSHIIQLTHIEARLLDPSDTFRINLNTHRIDDTCATAIFAVRIP